MLHTFSEIVQAFHSAAREPGMLPDPDTQRYERPLFALRLDHNVCLPTVEGIEQRVPVFEIHTIGVCPGLLVWVLAREVDLRAYSANLPSRQREVQYFS
jgi:hypothetical protein